MIEFKTRLKKFLDDLTKTKSYANYEPRSFEMEKYYEPISKHELNKPIPAKEPNDQTIMDFCSVGIVLCGIALFFIWLPPF